MSTKPPRTPRIQGFGMVESATPPMSGVRQARGTAKAPPLSKKREPIRQNGKAAAIKRAQRRSLRQPPQIVIPSQANTAKPPAQSQTNRQEDSRNQSSVAVLNAGNSNEPPHHPIHANAPHTSANAATIATICAVRQ